MKTIVLHDYFESLEGGGRLSCLLAEGLKTDLGYGFSTKNHPFLQKIEDQVTFRNLRSASALPLWRQLKLSLAFTHKTDFLTDYETVIYSGFYSPLAVKNHPNGQNILYCHTPPRFLYDQKDFYLSQLPPALRPALRAFIRYLQPRYEHAVAKMDRLVANSETVRKRIHHYLQREATIIHPPCMTEHFVWCGQENYYLSTARLDALKNVDKIVQAFLKMPDKQLIVTSGGIQLPKLRRLSEHATNIHFTGWVNDTELARWVGNAIATLYLPRAEDFGMSPVESMAAGKPVIGIAEGGLLETILPGKTGLLLTSPLEIEKICAAVEALTPQAALNMRSACERQAQNFRTELFLQKFKSIIPNF